MSKDWSEKPGRGILPPEIRAFRMICQSWKEILTHYYKISGVSSDYLQDDETGDVMISLSFDDTADNHQKYESLKKDIKAILSDISVTPKQSDGYQGLVFHDLGDAINYLGMFLTTKNNEIGQSLTAQETYYNYKPSEKLPDFAIRHLNFAIYSGRKSFEKELNAAYMEASYGHPMFHMTFHPWEIARIYNASKRTEICNTVGHAPPTMMGWYH